MYRCHEQRSSVTLSESIDTRVTWSQSTDGRKMFTDYVFLICEPKDISEFTTKCPAVKYTDGYKYTARIIALHENREILQQIQDILEKNAKLLFFKNIRITEGDQSYSNILKEDEKCPDATKLYLDPTIFSAQSTNFEDCIVLLRKKQKTKKFFTTQSHFIRAGINEALECVSVLIEPIPSAHNTIPILNETILAVHESENQKLAVTGSTEHFLEVRARNEKNVEDFVFVNITNKISGENSGAQGNVIAEEISSTRTTIPIVDATVSAGHDSGNRILAENGTTEEIREVQKSDKKTAADHAAQIITNEEKSCTERIFEIITSEGDTEDICSEEKSSGYVSEVRALVEENTMNRASKNRQNDANSIISNSIGIITWPHRAL